MSTNAPDVIVPEDGSPLPPTLDRSRDPLSLSEDWTREREKERRASERSAREASSDRAKEAAAAKADSHKDGAGGAHKDGNGDAHIGGAGGQAHHADNSGVVGTDHNKDEEGGESKDCESELDTKATEESEPGVWVHPSLLALSKFKEVPVPEDILGEMDRPVIGTFFRYELF